MTTRKELIIEKYGELRKELKSLVGDDCFFGIAEDIDIADLVFYITMIFIGVDTEIQYENKLRELLQTNEINLSDETEEKIIPLISEFVGWMKNL